MLTKNISFTEPELLEFLQDFTGGEWHKLADVSTLESGVMLLDDKQLNSFIIALSDLAMLYVDFEGNPELFEEIAEILGAVTYYSTIAYQYRHLKEG